MGCVDKVWPNLPVAPTCAKDSTMLLSAVEEEARRRAPTRAWPAVEEATAKGEMAEKAPKWPLPLYRSTANCSGQTSGDCNADIVEQPAQLEALSAGYAAYAHAVVARAAQAGRPFFLYVGFAHVHVPLFCAAGRANSTGRGPFADALAELDDTVGSILHPAPCIMHPASCTLNPRLPRHTCCGYAY